MQDLWNLCFGNAALIFWASPVIIQLCRLFVDEGFKGWYVTRWRSYYLGEMIIWPIFLGLVAELVDGDKASGFYTELWFVLSVAVIAWFISIANAWLANRNPEKRDSQIDQQVSERVHTIYFGFVVAAIVSSACALWYGYDGKVLDLPEWAAYVTALLGVFGVVVFFGDVFGIKIKKDAQTLENR